MLPNKSHDYKTYTDVISKGDEPMGPGHMCHPLSLGRGRWRLLGWGGLLLCPVAVNGALVRPVGVGCLKKKRSLLSFKVWNFCAYKSKKGDCENIFFTCKWTYSLPGLVWVSPVDRAVAFLEQVQVNLQGWSPQWHLQELHTGERTLNIKQRLWNMM